ncbi:hypothetical protein KIN20_027147 [Parelaphostrongylus tenuis]|uniref:Uncharacterized protein n=1 Tax=Parelaphostrongylus tenuis TaxID=148309 RepID=A0AAD5WDQ8_PARTN|nr:hypothetical protein KIN20_027147 [Parelaphostrongylus tenuis]
MKDDAHPIFREKSLPVSRRMDRRSPRECSAVNLHSMLRSKQLYSNNAATLNFDGGIRDVTPSNLEVHEGVSRCPSQLARKVSGEC